MPPPDPRNNPGTPSRVPAPSTIGPMSNSVPTGTYTPAGAPKRVGRYEVRRPLGGGGMGMVYLAHDPELDRPVALKVPRLAGPAAEERFLREARAAAAVRHPNLCPVYDAGRADGVLYLAMAYIPGDTLGQVLCRDGLPTQQRAAALAAAIARGMAEAHRHGIVHRDLKPGNVLIDARGDPVVTDFGLALTPASGAAGGGRLTEAGAVMGTPAYMSPEQAAGDLARIGPATDIYSLGTVLYEMLTGRPPFRAGDTETLLTMIRHESPARPSAERPGVAPGLDAVCLRAMAKLPEERFESMDAFADALAPFAAPPRGKRTLLAAGAAAAALLVLAAVVFLATRPAGGTTEVRLSDPAAAVRVRIDGVEVAPADRGKPRELRAGPHTLEVTGEGFEPETQTFNLERGQKLVLPVALRTKPPAAVAPAVTPPKPAPADAAAAVWDPKLKRTIEALFPDGVEKGIGRRMYGEVDTAIETRVDVEWRLGTQLTRDGKAVALKVTRGELSVINPTDAQAKAWDVEPRSINTLMSGEFAHRPLELVKLTPDGPVTLTRQPDGKLAVAVRFHSEVLSDQPVDSASVTIEATIRSDATSEETTKIFHQPGWTRPPRGEQQFRFNTARSSEGLKTEFGARVQIEAFVTQPRAGRYRISNVLTVPLVIK